MFMRVCHIAFGLWIWVHPFSECLPLVYQNGAKGQVFASAGHELVGSMQRAPKYGAGLKYPNSGYSSNNNNTVSCCSMFSLTPLLWTCWDGLLALVRMCLDLCISVSSGMWRLCSDSGGPFGDLSRAYG